jgi:carbonic anhydrase/acetyltransferase-like protein (isoleucine patch superfamily)
MTQSLDRPDIHPDAFVADTARVFGRVSIARDAVIMFGVVIRAELDSITIGSGTNIQDNAVVHCDEGVPTTIGLDTTVGHAAVIHGATIGERCLVGIGARALNGSEMGDGAWLAAGSVLPEGRMIPAWTLAMGIPAKPVRELTDEEIARQASGAAEYQRLRRLYLDLTRGTSG